MRSGTGVTIREMRPGVDNTWERKHGVERQQAPPILSCYFEALGAEPSSNRKRIYSQCETAINLAARQGRNVDDPFETIIIAREALDRHLASVPMSPVPLDTPAMLPGEMPRQQLGRNSAGLIGRLLSQIAAVMQFT